MPEFFGRLVDGPCGYYRILTRNLMLEVESTSQRGLTATGSGRNWRGISFRRQRGDILFLTDRPVGR